MPFIEAPTTFYLGRRYDPNTQRLVDEIVYYDSRDLTTHAVVVGMTGSGKTGMCINLLEEAILDNIPAIVIDPKGDITNLMLTFPDLRPEDFAPWVNPSDAQRAGLSIEEYARDVAQQWREGLAQWSIVPQRVWALKNAARFSIYTPGSDAGLPISILDSLQAPRTGWVGQEEFHREQISGLVTALMALIGKQVDPVKDREHVLISNIFEEAWKNGRDLTLEDIILQVQNPPFSRLGVFDVNTFFPERDRFKLAKELNHIIAAPSFQTWITGEPLDMRGLLYTRDGRPRVSIFYLAHLTEAERSFMITLILENMLAWMRTLSGTTSLRAIMYFDEVFGHFPPAPRNPPTKEPLLRLLKQARAFGIGLVLATQNPGDLDYKGLSNAGTWFIGKLQTENDKKRVLTGLESAATAENALNVKELDRAISGLAPRVFVLHNVHDEGGPILIHSRWAMSYLRGPLTRQQVRILMEPQRQMLGLVQPMAPAVNVPDSQPTAAASQPMQAVPPPLPPDEVPARRGPSGAASGAPPAKLPGEPPIPVGSTPPPAVLPEQFPSGSVSPVQPSSGAPSSFFDRLRSQPPTLPSEASPEPPTTPEPLRPFGAFTPPDPWASRPASPPTLPTGAQSPSFWLTPDDTPVPRPPAAPLPEGATAPPGSITQRGPALPEGYASKPPVLPNSIAQFYLPVTITLQQAVRNWEQKFNFSAASFGGAQLLYKPILLAQLAVRYLDRKSGVEADQRFAFHVPQVEIAGFISWKDYQTVPVAPSQLGNEPFGEAAYGVPTPGLTDSKRMRALRDEVIDYVSRSASLTLPYNSTLGVYGKPNEDQREFLARLAQVAREARDLEIDTITARYEKQLDDLDSRLRRAMRQATGNKEVLDELRREDLYTTGEAVLSLLRGRTTYTLSRMSRTRRFKKEAQERVVAGEQEIISLEEAIEAKQQELQDALRAVNEKWQKIASTVEDYKIVPFKKDITLEVFGIGWVPLWYVVLNGQPMTLNAFGG